jgi:glycosyltransferase involved in cell wall biosynthesis
MSISTQEVLLIDMQLFQTTAWDRGMGHYCRQLLQAYQAQYGSENIRAIVNKNLSFDAAREQAIRVLLPQADIVELDLPTLTGDIAASKQQALSVLDDYVESHLHGAPVVTLLLQLFTFDYCAAFPSTGQKSVIIYDLIPLLNWSQFSHLFAPHMYFPHFMTLFEADNILSISETTKHQLVESFTINPEKISNLGGATIERRSADSTRLVPKDTPFIIMPSADMPHKNNQTAVEAFAKFNRVVGEYLTLVVTSTFSEETKESLGCLSENIIFTGNIGDGELNDLYDRAKALLFTSSIEGLGLPILEAVDHDLPIICSTIPVFEEISKTAFYYCDPTAVQSIADALQAAFTKTNWAEKHNEYEGIKHEYTWVNSADRLYRAMQKTTTQQVGQRAPLVVVMPDPATTSSELGGFAQSLVPGLNEHHDVRVVVSRDDYRDETRKPSFLRYVTETNDSGNLPEVHVSDSLIYFIDTTSASQDAFKMALLKPGKCYVLNDRSSIELIEGLTRRGIVTTDLLDDANNLKAKDVSLVRLLEAAGNKVAVIPKKLLRATGGASLAKRDFIETI